MKSKSRYSFSYKIYMWWYRLTKEDVYKGIWKVFDFVSLAIVAILMFFSIFILPAFLH